MGHYVFNQGTLPIKAWMKLNLNHNAAAAPPRPREVHCFCRTSHCDAVGTTRVINASICLRSLGVMQSSSHVAKSCAVSCNICDKNVKYGPGRAKRGTIQLLEYQIPLFSVTSSPSSPSPKSPLASCCCSSTCSPR